MDYDPRMYGVLDILCDLCQKRRNEASQSKECSSCGLHMFSNQSADHKKEHKREADSLKDYLSTYSTTK